MKKFLTILIILALLVAPVSSLAEMKDVFSFCEQFAQRTYYLANYMDMDLYQSTDNWTNTLSSTLDFRYSSGYSCNAGNVVVNDYMQITKFSTYVFKDKDETDRKVIDLFRAAIAITCLEYSASDERMYNEFYEILDLGTYPFAVERTIEFEEMLLKSIEQINGSVSADQETEIYSGQYRYCLVFKDVSSLGLCCMLYAYSIPYDAAE